MDRDTRRSFALIGGSTDALNNYSNGVSPFGYIEVHFDLSILR